MQGPSPCLLGPLLRVFGWKIEKTHRPSGFLGYPLKTSKFPLCPDNLYSLITVGTSHGTLASVSVVTLLQWPCTGVLWLWAWYRPFVIGGHSPDLLFCSCRWSHVDLHNDEAEMLVRILLPLPELKKFGYVPRRGLFHVFIVCSTLLLTLILSETLFVWNMAMSSVISPEPCPGCELNSSLQFVLKVVIGALYACFEVFFSSPFLK